MSRMGKKKEKDAYEELLRKLKPSHVHFVHLYLGAEDGKCFNNATLSYLKAFNIETSTKKDKDGKYSKEYLNAKSRGYELVTNRDIQKFKNMVLLEQGYKPENIKRRFTELANQNKNLPVAHASVRDMAKIAGVLKEDSKSVDIPQLTELTEHIKKILTP